MDKNNVVSAEIVRQITRMVVEELQKQQRLERSTPIGVSNRHVHLDRACRLVIQVRILFVSH